MDGIMGYNDLKALQALINPNKSDSEDEDLPQKGLRKLGEFIIIYLRYLLKIQIMRVATY